MWLVNCNVPLILAPSITTTPKTFFLKDLNICFIYILTQWIKKISTLHAIKSSSGISERFTIHGKVMQGTVWAGLMCTCTMDKLGKLAYEDKQLLYKYKNYVDVPPLEMVNYVITASKRGNHVNSTNTAVNTFSKLKKLTLSEGKCSRLHVWKSKYTNCANISIDNKSI